PRRRKREGTIIMAPCYFVAGVGCVSLWRLTTVDRRADCRRYIQHDKRMLATSEPWPFDVGDLRQVRRPTEQHAWPWKEVIDGSTCRIDELVLEHVPSPVRRPLWELIAAELAKRNLLPRIDVER